MEDPLLYEEFPEYYTWKAPQGSWGLRQRNRDTFGRMYNVSVQNVELFCLRQLLRHVRGPVNYQELRTVNDVLFDTFREAAI